MLDYKWDKDSQKMSQFNFIAKHLMGILCSHPSVIVAFVSFLPFDALLTVLTLQSTDLPFNNYSHTNPCKYLSARIHLGSFY